MPRGSNVRPVSDISILAGQCHDEIIKGRDVIDYLEKRGVENPVETWYNVRRWMKSNSPVMYASIPMKFRLELPARKNEKPAEKTAEVVQIPGKCGVTENIKLYGDKKEEPDVPLEAIIGRVLEPKEPLVTPENATPAEKAAMEGFVPVDPPKKRGRPPRIKTAEAQDTRPVYDVIPNPDATEDLLSRFKVDELTGKLFHYVKGKGEDEGKVRVYKDGVLGGIWLTKEEAKTLIEELPMAMRLMFGRE